MNIQMAVSLLYRRLEAEKLKCLSSFSSIFVLSFSGLLLPLSHMIKKAHVSFFFCSHFVVLTYLLLIVILSTRFGWIVENPGMASGL